MIEVISHNSPVLSLTYIIVLWITHFITIPYCHHTIYMNNAFDYFTIMLNDGNEMSVMGIVHFDTLSWIYLTAVHDDESDSLYLCRRRIREGIAVEIYTFYRIALSFGILYNSFHIESACL